MRGRKVKITDEKNARKEQRERTKEVIAKTKDVEALSLKPPAYFSNLASKMWRNVIPILKKTQAVKKTDHAIVEAFCLNYESMVTAYEDIKEHGQVQAIFKTVVLPTGEVLKNENGKPKQDFVGYKRNPSTQIFDTATAKLKALASELGLTPASRAQLVNLATHKDDEQESFEKAMQQFM